MPDKRPATSVPNGRDPQGDSCGSENLCSSGRRRRFQFGNDADSICRLGAIGDIGDQVERVFIATTPPADQIQGYYG